MYFIGFSFQNHAAEIVEAPIVMLSGHKKKVGRGGILYGDLFANYSIFGVDVVWKEKIENPIGRIPMIAIMERAVVALAQNVST